MCDERRWQTHESEARDPIVCSALANVNKEVDGIMEKGKQQSYLEAFLTQGSRKYFIAFQTATHTDFPGDSGYVNLLIQYV